MNRADLKVGERYRHVRFSSEEVEVVDVNWGIVYLKISAKPLEEDDVYNHFLSVEYFLENFEPIYTVEGFEV